MTTLLAILVAVGGLWALAYIGAPLLVTSAAIAIIGPKFRADLR